MVLSGTVVPLLDCAFTARTGDRSRRHGPWYTALVSVCVALDLRLSFGDRPILDGVTFAVQPGDRIGLVGPNGSGKSTLLRVVGGNQEVDDGRIEWSRGSRCGYLPQDILDLPAGDIVNACRSFVPGKDGLEERIEGIEAGLAAAEDEETQLELAARLADLHERLADFENRFGRHRAERILTGLGFDPDELGRPVTELSGGWRMRVALAGLLLLDPDVLLLDEPTNHLDLPSLHWFDGFLKRSQKALVLVSHDRAFLNSQINRVLSFEPEGLRSFPGNYEDYRVAREEEARNLELQAKRQASARADAERFIERFRYKASKAKQAQSRMKQLERMDQIVLHSQHSTVRFRFPEVARAGREVVRMEAVTKAYGEHVIYEDLDVAIERGERIAIVGPNGAGKTTLLKLMASELVPDAGTVALGHNVEAAYFAQHHTEKLDPDRSILDEVWSYAPSLGQARIRGILGAFLFSGDEVDKKIRVLSGGERARVALARLLVVPSNLILMDEPTNHLDLDSSERLVEALAEYGGTLVFVSHNRSFIDQLATRVWDVRDRGVVQWPGNLKDYLHHLELSGKQWTDEEPDAGAKSSAEPERKESAKERRRREAEERQARTSRLGPLEDSIRTIEAEIAELEHEKQSLEADMADPTLYEDFARAQPITERFDQVKKRLEALYHQWAEQQDALGEMNDQSD